MGDLFELFAQNAPEELLFISEIVVDTLLIDLRPLGDTLHGRPIRTVCSEFDESRIFDLLFRAFGIPSHHLHHSLSTVPTLWLQFTS